MTRVSDARIARQGRPDESSRPEVLVQALFECDNCLYVSIGMCWREATYARNNTNDNGGWLSSLASEHVEWLPLRGEGRDFDDVPEEIGSAAGEAYRCASIGAHRAAVILARAVVEACAKEKGIVDSGVATKIDKLYAQNHIRAHIRDAAHEVRYLGNEMAHGDFVTPVTSSESDEVLAIMDEVLQEVFQSPARVARLQAARKARSQS